MLYILALLCLSTSPNWAKLNQMPADVLGFWRLSLASILLFGFLYFKKSIEILKLDQKNMWTYISGILFFLHLWTFKTAAKNTLISNMTVLYASNPIFASIGGALFFKEKLHFRTYISYLLAMISILFLVHQGLEFSPAHSFGNNMAIISAFLYALFMLSGKKARETTTNTTFAFHQYTITAFLFLVTTLITGHNLFGPYPSLSWIAVLGLVIFPTFLGHFLLTSLVKKMDIALLTCGKLIEPIFASLIAFFVFQERLSSSIYFSFILIVLSILILFWPQIKKKVLSGL